MKNSILILVTVLFAGSFAQAQTPVSNKMITLPGETSGTSFQVEVADKKISTATYYRYETTPRDQKIETSQVNLTLNRSSVYFHNDGVFWGVIPAKGEFKKNRHLQSFKLRDQNANAKCLLEVSANAFKVKRACADTEATLTPANQNPIRTNRTELTFDDQGNLAYAFSTIGPENLNDKSFFPNVQGMSLEPGSEGIRDMRLGLTFDETGALIKIKGSLLTDPRYPYSLRSESAIQLMAPASAEQIYLYYNNFIELELTREGTIAAARLVKPQTRTINGKATQFDLFYFGILGTVTHKAFGNSKDPVRVDHKRVLDSVSMGQAEDQGFKPAAALCGKFGINVSQSDTNPISKSSFYSIRRGLMPTSLSKDETLYDPGTESFVNLAAGKKVVLIGQLLCPQGTSVKY